MVADVGKPLDGQQTRSPDPKLVVGKQKEQPELLFRLSPQDPGSGGLSCHLRCR